ncbi:xanthine dehydrogenase accessory factor [Sphingobium sp. YR657]|uniref:XdhC family protein n=1 Tax=Sphingobium sp. YR657 TaxID=1884366 RepID=UPI00091B8777|nr:XdhC family protein [Sphingobium sp. YR657]SHM45783.1 xanthine dehydrogenase accessory factor [Sphingobium sp. YR657]
MADPLTILRFLRARLREGQHAVLVTLTDVTGSGARAPGAHLAVAEDGRAMGSFSGGCVEAAVIAEALDALGEGKARQVRYGAGSRYIDIRLPCGGAIDLLFTPVTCVDAIEQMCRLLEQRWPATLVLPPDGSLAVRPWVNGEATGWADGRFLVRHRPTMRVVALGHGAEPVALMRVAVAYGAEATVLSPDAGVVEDAWEMGITAARLDRLGRSVDLAADPWTAVVMLFHDHDWETPLLEQALEQAPFFIGAMGSRRTHAERCERLRDAGVSETRIARIVGPIGLIKASRDPAALAISIMAQIVETYGKESINEVRHAQTA